MKELKFSNTERNLTLEVNNLRISKSLRSLNPLLKYNHQRLIHLLKEKHSLIVL